MGVDLGQPPNEAIVSRNRFAGWPPAPSGETPGDYPFGIAGRSNEALDGTPSGAFAFCGLTFGWPFGTVPPL